MAEYPRPHTKEKMINRRQILKRTWAATLQGYTRAYDRADEGHHRGPDETMKMPAGARDNPANLLLNTGLLTDGSIHPEDVATLKEVGRRLNT
jgi:hypothetical protein